MTEPSVIEVARECVREITWLEKMEAPVAWRLADLTAENTLKSGDVGRNRVAVPAKLSMPEWAEQIGWVAAGRAAGTLGKMAAEARAWPQEQRVEEASFWQHHEARMEHKNISKASHWLREKLAAGEGVTAPRPRQKKLVSAWDKLNKAFDLITDAQEMADWDEWLDNPELLESGLAAESLTTAMHDLGGIRENVRRLMQLREIAYETGHDEFDEIVEQLR